jgi:two-component system NtrC family sensor kinase
MNGSSVPFPDSRGAIRTPKRSMTQALMTFPPVVDGDMIAADRGAPRFPRRTGHATERRHRPAEKPLRQKSGQSKPPIKATAAVRGRRPSAELRERLDTLTRELTEARKQQAATGEILASIAGSISDAKPVFDAIARNLRRLFSTHLVVVHVLKDGMVHLAAAGSEREFNRLSKHFPQAVDENTGSGRAILSKQVRQYAPVLGNADSPPATQQFARELGFNSVIFAPMIRGGKVIGSLATARREPKAFDDKQVALIRAFADQAVIAVESVRLFEAEQERTRELTESLQQQTATANVLKVISRATFDLPTVLDALLRSAGSLCEADMGAVLRPESERFIFAASFGFPQAFIDLVKDLPIEAGRETLTGRVMIERRPVHIPDVQADPDLSSSVPCMCQRQAIRYPQLT